MKSWIIILLVFGVFQSTNAQTPQQLPEKGNQYETYRDNSVSDEFNGKELNTKKWGRRSSGGYPVSDHYKDESLVGMKQELDGNGKQLRFVSIIGTTENGKPKTAGLVSRASGYYGFYVVKFRFKGFDTEDVKRNGTVWHPSVWSGIQGHLADEKKSSVVKKDFWLEIDFMEWETNDNGWSSDAPARIKDSKGVKRKVITKGKGLEKGIMKGPETNTSEEWQTIGLEYTPEYLKIWGWNNGKWEHIGDRVVSFIEEDKLVPEKSYTINTIGKSARTPCFWLLGNVVSRYLLPSIDNGTVKRTMNDMTVDFDFFRYYRHKSTKNIDWPWENGVKSGGGKVKKDSSKI